MHWKDKIKEYFFKQGFGVYLIELKNQHFFDVDANKKVIDVLFRENSDYPLDYRVLSGTHRKSNDLSETHLSLEAFNGFDAVIPYSSIKNFEKIRDSFYVSRELNEELRKASSFIINRLNESN